MIETLKSCVFCHISESSPDQLNSYDRPLLETENFFVITALGQFSPGYLLICPKDHYLNFGLINHRDFSEFIDLKEKVKKLLTRIYNISPIFFEHGATSAKHEGGTCVEHAHIHVIPVMVTSPTLWESDFLNGGYINGYSELFEYVKSGKPYLFFENSSGEMFLYDSILAPCQYGRRIISQILGKGDFWDWRKYPMVTETVSTYNKLRKVIEENHEE